MRKTIAFLLATVLFGIFAKGASAFQLSQRVTANELKNACGKAGGVFSQDQGGHSCAKPCSGRICVVACDNKNVCEGDCPNCPKPARTRAEVGIRVSAQEVLGNLGIKPGRNSVAPATMSGSILDGSGGFTAQGPSGAGAPVTPPRPSAPPPQIR